MYLWNFAYWGENFSLGQETYREHVTNYWKNTGHLTSNFQCHEYNNEPIKKITKNLLHRLLFKQEVGALSIKMCLGGAWNCIAKVAMVGVNFVRALSWWMWKIWAKRELNFFIGWFRKYSLLIGWQVGPTPEIALAAMVTAKKKNNRIDNFFNTYNSLKCIASLLYLSVSSQTFRKCSLVPLSLSPFFSFASVVLVFKKMWKIVYFRFFNG